LGDVEVQINPNNSINLENTSYAKIAELFKKINLQVVVDIPEQSHAGVVKVRPNHEYIIDGNTVYLQLNVVPEEPLDNSKKDPAAVETSPKAATGEEDGGILIVPETTESQPITPTPPVSIAVAPFQAEPVLHTEEEDQKLLETLQYNKEFEVYQGCQINLVADGQENPMSLNGFSLKFIRFENGLYEFSLIANDNYGKENDEIHNWEDGHPDYVFAWGGDQYLTRDEALRFLRHEQVALPAGYYYEKVQDKSEIHDIDSYQYEVRDLREGCLVESGEDCALKISGDVDQTFSCKWLSFLNFKHSGQ
jgi:hypothetical protein